VKHKMVMGIQVVPQAENVYGVVDAAIDVIASSGLRYQVCPMETVVEADDIDALLDVAKKAHQACLMAGARSTITYIKLAEHGQEENVTIDQLMEKYR